MRHPAAAGSGAVASAEMDADGGGRMRSRRRWQQRGAGALVARPGRLLAGAAVVVLCRLASPPLHFLTRASFTADAAEYSRVFRCGVRGDPGKVNSVQHPTVHSSFCWIQGLMD